MKIFQERGKVRNDSFDESQERKGDEEEAGGGFK